MLLKLAVTLGMLSTTALTPTSNENLTCDSCDLAPFELSYDVSRNGKPLGEAQFSLHPAGEGLWVLEMRVEATKGLASVAGYSEVERSTLRADVGGWLVQSYERKRKVAFRNRDEQMRFDWNRGELHSDREGKSAVVQLPPRTVDSNSLSLLLGNQLKSGLPITSYSVARRGKVDQWQFELVGAETLNGVAVQRVERRRENSERTTTSWYSAAHGYLPIRLQQVEDDGETITMSLRTASGSGAGQ